MGPMKYLLSDVRFALRLFRRGPAFFITLLAILIAGIGATTAMFSIANSLLLKPLPYRNAEQLTMIWATQPMVNPSPVSIPDFNDWKEQATLFDKMSATNYSSFGLTSEGARPESLAGANVTGDFFAVLGLEPLRGRLLGPDDDRAGGPRVAVVSAELWHRRFGSDPSLVGRTITLGSEPYTVVGVAPEGFRYSGPFNDGCDVWTPLAVTYPNYTSAAASERGSHFLHVMGRRKPGVSLEQAQVQLTAIAKSIEAAHPESNTKVGVRLVDLHEALVGSSRTGVWVLFGAVALVFFIVCANVANLLLTRAQTRRGEMAARSALGATSSRLAGQIVTETVVVFLLGAAGGAVVARWLVELFAEGVVNEAGAATIGVSVDGTALLFSIVTCLVCGIACGLVPALSVSRIEPQAVLKESAARASIGRTQRNVRSGLVVAQVALAFALLTGGALALKAFAKTAATPPGFDPNDLATVRIVLPDAKYADDEKVAKFYRDTIARVAAQPGVESVAVNSALPMAGSNNNGSFRIEGRPVWRPGERPVLERNVITPGYFKVMRIPLLRGRDITADDRRNGRRVMLISQDAAERFFPGEDPIGHRIDLNESGVDQWCEIIGVVGDVRKRGLGQRVWAESYIPLEQHTEDRSMVLVARSPRAEALLAELPRLIQEIDPDQAAQSPMLMTRRVARTIGNQRYVAMMLGAFAAAALLLATLGIFGLMSYSASQRTRELGIRMALGSTPEAVIALVMKGGVRLVAAGLALGLIGALAVGRVLASRVSGVAAFDLSVVVAIPAILGVAGLLACLIPAWRAVRIPPASALRYE